MGSLAKNHWAKKARSEQNGYAVYYLPEEHYVGVSVNVRYRINKHRHLGRVVDGWEVIAVFERGVDAHWFETLFHMRGYNGYRP